MTETRDVFKSIEISLTETILAEVREIGYSG